MDITKLYDLFLSSTGVCTDTRKLQEGQLYVALKGGNFNGNKFADQALNDGAIAALIDEPSYEGNRKVLVPDCLKTLQALAAFHRKQLDIPVIGLTGSNGKTTSKELVVAVLKEKFRVSYTQGNLNNHIGVPLSLLEIGPEAEIAVIEMGANAQKEIEFLANMALPDIGFITNYGKAHLEGFGGPEGVVKGKSELYENLRSNGKIAWVNSEDPLQVKNSADIEQYRFGANAEADYPVFPMEEGATYVGIRFQGIEIQSQLTGSYNFTNLAIAASLGAHFGLSPIAIKRGIEGYHPTNNRSQLEKGQANLLVKDYYNANPSSMEAALANFRTLSEAPDSDKWVILGDMFELGPYEAEEHQKVADLALRAGFEKTILVGEAFAKTAGESLKFGATQEALDWILSNKPHSKLILVKGSRGMTLEKIAAVL